MLWCQLCSLQTSYKRKKRNRRRLRCFDQHNWYWKSLNLIKEDWSENYTLWLLSQVFKCVWSYNNWEVAALKRRGTDHQIELKEVNRKELKVLWDSLYNMTKRNY
jgi:hypothetical protein